MTLSFYIGSKIENAAQVRELRDIFACAGWNCTYDWTAHGSVRGPEATPEILRSVAGCETDGAMFSDVVVILLPGGRGTHSELGIAIASAFFRDKTVLIWAPDGELFAPTEATSVFYHHENVSARVVGGTMQELAGRAMLLAGSKFGGV